MRLIDRLNPRADKKVLILIAGIMWCGVGVMLVSFALTWLGRYDGKGLWLYYCAGFLAAMPIHFFGFSKIAGKNLARLLPLREKRCVFSFITWKSYFIIVVMMAMGITMRHSSLPKQYLSILYNGIGLGLFLSGTNYFRAVINLRGHSGDKLPGK
jgi:hypothetical protein